MKLLLILILLVKCVMAFNYKLEPYKINESTSCFFGFSQVMDEHNNGNISNSCFVNMGTSYLVIDSGPTYSYARQAYEKMKKIKNLPISYVINTHVHDDHWLGNSYYWELGAKIVGSQQFFFETKVEMTRMQKRISPEAFLKTTQIFPFIFVEDKMLLDFNDKKAELIRIHKQAHTKSDLIVYIPSQKIVFVGDLVFNDRLPSIRDGNLGNWLEALDAIRAMDVDFVVGGHGKIVDRSSIDMTYEYISTLKKEVTTMLEDGEDIAYAVENIIMEKFKNMNFYDSMHKQNVEIAYRMLEWES